MKKTLLLSAIILVGLLLRSINLNLPSIGYHNMKENESLSIAQEMEGGKDFLKKKVYFYDAFDPSASLKADCQPPLVAFQTILAWKLFGENIWAPRLINVFFGLASIILLYFISLTLFESVAFALVCSLALAVMPLAVFFSRNIQPESPALFFMLLGSLFYLRFFVKHKKYNLVLGGLSLVISWLYKFNFLIACFPAIFCFFFRPQPKKREGLIMPALVFLLPYLSIPVLIILFSKLGIWYFRFDFAPREFFSLSFWKDFWPVFSWYVGGENFTFIFSLLASFGIILAFFNREKLLGRYIIGWSLAAIIYVALFARQLTENSFSQMPFLLFVCVSGVYGIAYLWDELKKRGHAVFLIIFICIVSISFALSTKKSLERMYGTVFPGQDAAGETLKELTSKDERVFLFTFAQGNAIPRYARRFVYWPQSLEDFKEKETRFGMRFVCIYPGEFLEMLKQKYPAIFEYLQENYRLKEVGLMDSANRLGYIILEKGKDKDKKKLTEALQSVTGALKPRTIYRMQGKYVFFYTIRP